MNPIFYVLEYNHIENKFHIPCLGEPKLNTNGYKIVASSKEHYDLIKLSKLIRSIYNHPTYEEIDLVVGAFPNNQDTNL